MNLTKPADDLSVQEFAKKAIEKYKNSKNITDQVFWFIQNDSELMHDYLNLIIKGVAKGTIKKFEDVKNRWPDTANVNKQIAKIICEEFGNVATGEYTMGHEKLGGQRNTLTFGFTDQEKK